MKTFCNCNYRWLFSPVIINWWHHTWAILFIVLSVTGVASAQIKVWDKTLGGNKPDNLAAMIPTPDGGYLLGGSSASAMSGDKTQNNKGVPDGDGNATSDYWIVKTDKTGKKIWDKTFGGSADDKLTTLIATPDGGYLLGGSSRSGKSGDKSENNLGTLEKYNNRLTTDYWVVKIDASGNKIWDQTYGGNKADDLAAIITVPDGGFLLGGSSTSDLSGDKSQNNKGVPDLNGDPRTDYWILKIDAAGKKIWDYTYGGTSDDNLAALLTPDTGGFLLGGSSSSGISGDKSQANRGYADYWVIRLNANGIKIWDKTYGGITEDADNIWCEENCSPSPIGASFLSALVATPDGGFLLGGSSNAAKGAEKSENNLWSDSYGLDAGLYDYWVVKIDTQGNKLWDNVYGGINVYLGEFVQDWYYTGDSKLTTILATPDGGYVLGGYSNSDKGRDKSEFSRREEEKSFELQRRYDYWVVKINGKGEKQWDKTIGGTRNDYLADILLVGESNYILGGSSASEISGDKSEANRYYVGDFDEETTDYWLVKIQVNETPTLAFWNKRYGGAGADQFTSVIQTSDGGYLVGGYTNSGVSGDKSQSSRGGNDYWIVKSDKNGAKLWEKRFGGPGDDYLNTLIQTQDGGYLLGGHSVSGSGGDKSQISRGSSDYWIVKISSTGEKQWDQRYGGSSNDELRQILQLPMGEYLLAGTSSSPAGGDKSQGSQGGNDYWVVKISINGAKQWDKRYGGSLNDILEGLAPTLDGGFLLGGRSTSGVGGDKTQASRGGSDYWLVRISESGYKLWDKRFGGTGTDDLMVVGSTGTSTGNFFIAGHSTSGISGDKTQASRGGKDFWMLKINANGEKIFDKRFGGSQDEGLRSIVLTSDGGYLLAGRSESGVSGDKTQASQGGNDYWMVKTSSTGILQWDKRFGGSGDDELRTAFQTSDGGYLLGGRSDSGVSGDRMQPSQGITDYWLVKVAPITSSPMVAARVASQPEAVNQVQEVQVQAYPNPFQEKATIRFSLPETQTATVKVYDSQGREVATLFNGEAKAKQPYEVEWKANHKAAGLYILQLQTPTKKQQQKLLLTK